MNDKRKKMANETMYLVGFRLVIAADESIRERIIEDVPGILTLLKQMSVDDPLPVYISDDNGTFGYALRSTWDAKNIVRQLESPGTNDRRRDEYYREDKTPSPLNVSDQVFAVQIGGGGDYWQQNLARLGTRLQRER